MLQVINISLPNLAQFLFNLVFKLNRRVSGSLFWRFRPLWFLRCGALQLLFHNIVICYWHFIWQLWVYLLRNLKVIWDINNLCKLSTIPRNHGVSHRIFRAFSQKQTVFVSAPRIWKLIRVLTIEQFGNCIDFLNVWNVSHIVLVHRQVNI